MKINVPRALALAGRRLDGHPLDVMQQVAVCELAVEAHELLERVRAILTRRETEGGYDEMDAIADIAEVLP
jgi:hypothetical protein